MATKQCSPTGNLLRRSRLFSLPLPLRKPQAVNEDIRDSSSSGTRSTIYPTHAAIETPQSSLCRGDWGLKRPLPLRTTTSSSTPVIRVQKIDSTAHIVDFESASDHVQTLRKVQEMNIPVVKQRHLSNIARYASALEDDLLPSSANSVAALGKSRQPRRWKYRGPFVAGLEQGKFDTYLDKQVKSRRDRFLRYLWAKVVEKHRETMKKKSIDEGLDDESSDVKLSPQDFAAALVKLRQERTELWRYIREFFNLSDELLFSAAAESSIDGPPATHPTAGLSYLASDAVTPNHPTFGPTRVAAPVPTRALADRVSMAGSRGFDKVGVGGIVAQGSSGLVADAGAASGNERGGSKVWAHPQRMSVNASGRINLRVTPGHVDSRSVWKDVAYTKPEEPEEDEPQARKR